ncbi:hypothetical protein EON79_05280 [bacterium]|nr:MAG: hypothetical protein EON79_05280 [bacterium]
MIVGPSLHWGSVMRAMAPQLISVAVLSVAAVWLVDRNGQTWISLPGLPLTVITASLGIFLGFRNNSAYDRWWEARTLWGGMVNEGRTLVRRAGNLGDEALAQSAARHVAGFAQAARRQLRDENPTAELNRIFGDEEGIRFARRRSPAIAVLEEFAQACRVAFNEGRIGENRLVALEDSLSRLTDCYGGCERIKNTPMIRLYDDIPQAMVYIVMALLPFALVKELHWFTPPSALLVAFLFLSLDMIGRTVESPFASTINDVPITAIATNIEADAFAMTGAGPVPEPIRPVDGYLL